MFPQVGQMLVKAWAGVKGRRPTYAPRTRPERVFAQSGAFRQANRCGDLAIITGVRNAQTTSLAFQPMVFQMNTGCVGWAD